MSVTQYALSSLKSLLPKLNVGNQHYLFSAATRALATAQRRRENHLLEFWSGRLVVSIALASSVLVHFRQHPGLKHSQATNYPLAHREADVCSKQSCFRPYSSPYWRHRSVLVQPSKACRWAGECAICFCGCEY